MAVRIEEIARGHKFSLEDMESSNEVFIESVETSPENRRGILVTYYSKPHPLSEGVPQNHSFKLEPTGEGFKLLPGEDGEMKYALGCFQIISGGITINHIDGKNGTVHLKNVSKAFEDYVSSYAANALRNHR